MVEERTLAEMLRAIWRRSGLSMREAARRAGYAQASSIQRYIDGTYDKDAISIEVANKLADAFEGTGDPPIRRADLFALTGYRVEPDARPFQMEGSSQDRMARDVPVFGTALGAPEVVEGEAIEQTTLNSGEIVTYFRRPGVLNGRTDIYGLFIQGSSMYPRFSEGETAFVETRRPPRVGDDVVVYLRMPDEELGERASCVLIKRLVRRTGTHVELEQFNPPVTFRLPAQRVARIDRVVPWTELLS